MFKSLAVRKSQGTQYIPDLYAAQPGGFRGKPVIADTPCTTACQACVEVCPSQARIFGDQQDPNSKISQILKKEKSFRLQEDKKTKPNVHYVGKYSPRA